MERRIHAGRGGLTASAVGLRAKAKPTPIPTEAAALQGQPMARRRVDVLKPAGYNNYEFTTTRRCRDGEGFQDGHGRWK
jgi:hypothetical protein